MTRVSVFAALAVLAGSVPVGAQVADCAVPGIDDRCEAWVSVYDEVGPRSADLWYLRPSLDMSPGGETVYLTGRVRRPGEGLDPVLSVANDTDTGARRWAARYDGPDGTQPLFLGSALSPDGSALYAAGYQITSTPYTADAFVVARDAGTGDLRWVALFDGGSGGWDAFRSVAVSPDSATVYATGWTREEGGDTRLVVVAFDALSGDVRWQAGYDGPRDDDGFHVAAAPDGTRLYVAGERGRTTGSEPWAGDTVVLAFDTDEEPGRLLWTSVHGDPGAIREHPQGLRVTPDGTGVVVAGTTDPYAASVPEDAFAVAYQAGSGALLWATTYDGPASGRDSAEALALSPSGDRAYLAVTAATVKSDSDSLALAVDTDMAVVAIDLGTGTQLWESMHGTPGYLDEYARGVAVSPDGEQVFATMASARTWMGMDSSDGTGADLPLDIVTVALDADGVRSWVARYNSDPAGTDPSRPGAVVVAPDGSRVFVGGPVGHPVTLGQSGGFATLAYDAS